MRYCVNGLWLISLLSLFYAFFSTFNFRSWFDIAELKIWLILLFAASPYATVKLCRPFLGSTAVAISVIGLYGYLWISLPTKEDKSALVFIAIPLYQWLFVLICSLILALKWVKQKTMMV